MKNLAVWLYLLNAAILATHEIDSAYWHEWRLLGLPDGIQLFLILNLLLLVIVLYGFKQVCLWDKHAKLFSYLLAGIGIFAFSIHLVLILLGNPEFRLPMSLTVLAGTLLVSLAQIVVVARH